MGSIYLRPSVVSRLKCISIGVGRVQHFELVQTPVLSNQNMLSRRPMRDLPWRREDKVQGANYYHTCVALR